MTLHISVHAYVHLYACCCVFIYVYVCHYNTIAPGILVKKVMQHCDEQRYLPLNTDCLFVHLGDESFTSSDKPSVNLDYCHHRLRGEFEAYGAINI